MPLTDYLKEKISIEVIKTLVTRFENFPEDASSNRNAPFHETFLKAFADKLQGKVSDVPFFISLSSWLQGLNTTLGQTFFENVAHHLCNGEKREYTSKKLGNLQITQTQKDNISNIITDLSNAKVVPNLADENESIYTDYESSFVNALDFSADVFFEDEKSVTAIELKSVKPNSGEMRGEKQKIMEGKAALHRKFPKKNILFYIGFPFDPTVDPKKESVTGSNKTRFLGSIINMNKYFDQAECLVASELWDFLSGYDKTMEQILEIINSIATPKFLEKFHFLNDTTNRNKSNYLTQLNEWYLFSERELIQKEETIKGKIGGDKKLIHLYNKSPFDNVGNYNIERYANIIKVLN